MTQPWSNQAVSLIEILANPQAFTGLFVYSGPPAAGNLIGWIAANNGTDPKGNPYLKVVGSQSAGIIIFMNGSQLSWDQPTDHPFTLPGLFATPSAANGNTVEITTAEGVIASSPAAATFYDSAASAGVGAIPAGSPGIFLAGGCYLYSDTWNSLGSPGITGLTTDAGRYRFAPNGDVEIDVNCHANTAVTSTTGTFAQALPAQYRPAADRVYPLGQPIAGDASGRIGITAATGVISLHIPTLANGNRVGNTFLMPTT